MAVAATYQVQRVVAWLAMGATGTVRSRRTPGGEVRYYLDFRPHGRVWALPTELGPVPLTDAALAHRLLEQIRGRVAGGEALEGVLDGLRRGARSHVLRRATDWLDAKAAEAEARAKAETIVTPPAACMNRDYRRVVSVEPLEAEARP